jgi:hypothetical protein
MNPLSIFLTAHLIIGLLFGIYVLQVIKRDFGSNQDFYDEIRLEIDPVHRIFLPIISTPLNMLVLFTLLGFFGVILWLWKD